MINNKLTTAEIATLKSAINILYDYFYNLQDHSFDTINTAEESYSLEGFHDWIIAGLVDFTDSAENDSIELH